MGGTASKKDPNKNVLTQTQAAKDALSDSILLPTYSTRPPLHPLTLSFYSDSLERDFHEFSVKRSLGFARVVLLLAIFLYLIFGVLDYFIIPESIAILLTIRVVISFFILGCIGVTYTKKGIENLQLVLSLVVIIATLGIIYLMYVPLTISGQHYYAGIILAIMYAHGLMRLRFIYASITTWLVICIYIFVFSFLAPIPFETLLNNTFFIVAANIMGMFTSYWIEFYMRNSYWQSKQLENKSLELNAEYTRKSDELDISRRLQLDLLPKASPYHPDYNFAFFMNTATEIGGDYYDFLIDNNQNITLAIGDATGHGARAGAMVMAVKILFSDHAGTLGLAEFLSRASATLRSIGLRKLYMAFAIARIENYHCYIAGAGLPKGILYRHKTRLIEVIELKGLPLGSPSNFPYREQHFEFHPGDTLMLMTDGFPELFDSEREIYGYENTIELFKQHASLEPVKIVNKFIQITQSWLNGNPQNDDITFIVIQRKKQIPAD